MNEKNHKMKWLKVILVMLVLLLLLYAFVEWREQRLERRAKMLHQETQLDLSQVGSEGKVEFLIDSNTGRQYVYVDVYTSVKVLEKDIVDGVERNILGVLDKEAIKSSRDNTKKMDVDIYTKYKIIDNNPNKYQDWKNIELEIIIKNKFDNSIYITKRCLPYDFSKGSENYNLRSTCYMKAIPNGLYVANIKVLKSNIDFKNNKSTIIFAYSGVGDDVDFWSRILDSVLRNFLGLLNN